MKSTTSAPSRFTGLSKFYKLVVASVGGLAALVATAPAQAQGWPAGLKAEYEVTFNGFSIGSFEFRAQSEQQSYTLVGNASLSMLLGAINWKGDLRSFGSIVNLAPKPASYTFEARAGSRAVATHLGFDDGTVSSVAHVPELPAKPDMVPLKPAHLQNVLDPLSAMMQVTSGATPCDRRLPIFDGRERFDLVLSRKGETRITEQQPSGQPSIGHVCKVRYVPIAGHAVDSENKFMASNDSIELVLRPIPAVKLYVPYQITIPTLMGSATLTSKRVEIVQAGRRIALLH